jgi:hypothetical protein
MDSYGSSTTFTVESINSRVLIGHCSALRSSLFYFGVACWQFKDFLISTE